MSYAFRYLFLLFIVGLKAEAAIVKLSDLGTMAKRSDIVIHGQVGDQVVTTDELSRLITLTQIEVIEPFYGGAKTGDVVTFYQVGGKKNGLVMPMLGGQRYNVGQEVILFGLQLGNTFVSYGAGQGKLDVINDGGRDIVIEDLGDVHAISPKDRKIFKPMPESYVGKEILKNEIRQMIKFR